jgi:hypothetical protein
MGITQYFRRTKPVSITSDARTTPASSLFWPLFASNFILSALSIANLGLISSMVGFLLDQKHNVHSYRINWPATAFDLNVEPAHMWTDQGHTSNGVAGYGFFLGLLGMFIAWRVRRSAVRQLLFYTSVEPLPHADITLAAFEVSHSSDDSPAPRHPLHSQRPNLRFPSNISNHRTTHPRPHRRQQPRQKL